VSNDKDKVVGILGMLQLSENSLAKPQQKQAFCPDYTWSVDKVYVMLAKYLLTAGRLRSRLNESVKMLCHAGLDRQTAASNLPSWVPDWRAQSLRRYPKPIAPIRGKPYATPPRGSLPLFTILGDNEEQEALIADGWIGDTIHSIVAEKCYYNGTDPEFLQWLDMARDIYDTAVPSGSLGYENPLEAFCRTLFVDDLNSGEDFVPGCSAIENPVEF
jgi:hypothetical protein